MLRPHEVEYERSRVHLAGRRIPSRSDALPYEYIKPLYVDGQTHRTRGIKPPEPAATQDDIPVISAYELYRRGAGSGTGQIILE